MKRKVVIGIIVSIIAIVLFIFFRALYCQYWFSSIVFSNEIAPLDVFNILFSGTIAIWLGWYITKKLTEQRFLKEFIIKDIYRIEEQIESFEKMTQNNKLELQTIFNELHELRNKIERFEKTTAITHFSSSEITNLSNYHKELFKITTTDTVFKPIDSKNQINQICNSFILSLRKMVLEINRN